MIGACAASGPYGPEAYVVRPQDTLYSIAWRHNLDYRELAKWNDIGSDYRVSVGQRLVLSPGGAAASRPAARSSPSSSQSQSPQRQSAGVQRSRDAPQVGRATPLPEVAGSSTAPGAAAAGAAGQGATAPAGPLSQRGTSAQASSAGPGGTGTGGTPPGGAPLVGGHLKWVWPTDRTSAPVAVSGGGILLLGKLGQDVRAAGTGRVVYTGSGLRGYGNLIIIKHGDSLLSSYAHNREILVHEGQDVVVGQTIAHMGTGAHQVSALYFEIRVNGKPTDPLRYLR